MSNTGSPRRTELEAVFARATPRGASIFAATALLSIAMISFKPFQPLEATVGGDIVNQLGFGTLGVISLMSLMLFADPRKLSGLLAPSMIVVVGFLFFSVGNAVDPSAALRSASFTLIGMLTMAAVLLAPRDADAFSAVLLASGTMVIGLSCIGLVLFPEQAIHQAASIEPQHEGLWRGVFTHKNIAGPVMACYSFCGLYLYRRGWKIGGAALFLAAMIFTINTGSKTTAGLVPLSMVIIMLPGLFGVRALTAVLFGVAIVGTALATLGIVFIEPIRLYVEANLPDLTYTGRVTLWEFAGEMVARRPWTGYGFESFWGTDTVMNTDQPFDRPWDIRPMVHGHNGYIDIAVIMGLPALGAFLWAFFVAPIRDYLHTPRLRENVHLADLFMMILLFTSLNAFLESFFFRRADPVWLFFIFSVLGLRLAARFPAGRQQA